VFFPAPGVIGQPLAIGAEMKIRLGNPVVKAARPVVEYNLPLPFSLGAVC